MVWRMEIRNSLFYFECFKAGKAHATAFNSSNPLFALWCISTVIISLCERLADIIQCCHEGQGRARQVKKGVQKGLREREEEGVTGRKIEAKKGAKEGAWSGRERQEE